MNRTTDYLILGAGVIGTSIAFHLAQRKSGRITVIDKAFVGQGNSGRSSALVRMHYAHAPEVQMAVLGYKVFSSVFRRFRFAKEWDSRKSTVDRARLERWARSAGFRVERVERRHSHLIFDLQRVGT